MDEKTLAEKKQAFWKKVKRLGLRRRFFSSMSLYRKRGYLNRDGWVYSDQVRKKGDRPFRYSTKKIDNE